MMAHMKNVRASIECWVRVADLGHAVLAKRSPASSLSVTPIWYSRLRVVLYMHATFA